MRGGTSSLIAIGLLVIATLLLLTYQLGVHALTGWVLFAGIAYPFLRAPARHPILTFDRIALGSMASLVLLHPRVRPASRPTRFMILALVWLMLVTGARGLLTHGLAKVNFELTVDAFLLPLVLFVAANKLLTTRSRIQTVAGASVVGGCILALIGISEKIWGYNLAVRAGGVPRFDVLLNTVRVSGPFEAPEPYALSLLIALAVTFYWLQSRRAYVYGGFAVALQAAALALTFFRTAWVAALVMAVVAFGARRRRFMRMVFVAGAILLVVFIAFGRLDQYRLFSVRAHNTSNIQGRFATYDAGFKIFKQSPIYGVGVNRYSDAATGVPAVSYNGIQAFNYPHSTFFWVLAEQGLIGIVPLFLTGVAVVRLLRSLSGAAVDRADQILAASLSAAAVGYLLMSLTLTMLPYGVSNAYLLLLLGAGAARLDALREGKGEAAP